MSLISIPSDELKAMDRRLAEQQQLLREQQQVLQEQEQRIERIFVLLQPWINAGKEQP